MRNVCFSDGNSTYSRKHEKLLALFGVIGLTMTDCVAYEAPYRGHPEYHGQSDRDMRHRDDRMHERGMDRHDDGEHRRDMDRRDDDDRLWSDNEGR